MVPSKRGASSKPNQHSIFPETCLKKDMEIKLEDSEQYVYKKKSQRGPPKPVMKRCERDLPFHKDTVVELFDDRGDTEQEKEKTADHSRPPYEIITEKRCCYLS